MPTLITKYLEVRRRLAYRLFAYYGLLMTLLIIVALNMPKFDAREFSPISVKEHIFFTNESLHTEQNLNLDEIFERNLSVETENGFDVILADQASGNLSGVNQSNIKALQTFIYQSRHIDEPRKRRFENSEIYGPFVVNSPHRTYNQYFIKAVEEQEKWISTLLDSSLMMLILMMVLGAPFLLWLTFKITKPVRELAISANAVAQGNLTVNPHLETDGIYEIRQVGKIFNHMITNLQEITRQQQRMISDISHELKTPLARLQLSIAILRRKNGESAEMQRIESEVHKLDRMIQDLLSISRQQLQHPSKRSSFPIDEIWQDVLDDAEFEAKQKGLRLLVTQKIERPHRYVINGYADTLASALENLIRNGQKYAKKIMSITIAIEENRLKLSIEDDGPGVPSAEYYNIFKPFYRLDEARARETGGSGLGLAIVHNAVSQHQGEIKVGKSHIGGLKVDMLIPLGNPTAK